MSLGCALREHKSMSVALASSNPSYFLKKEKLDILSFSGAGAMSRQDTTAG